MDSEGASRALASMRLSMGTAAILAPRTLARAFGIDPHDNPAGPLIARLFGARNLALGITLLRAGGEERAWWLRASVAIDAFDALATVAGRARGYLSGRTTALGVAAGLTAVATAVLAQRPSTGRLSRP